MTKLNETLVRQWTMLRMVPRFPFKITASELTGRLAGEGFVTSKRTIERDLHELSRSFPLMLDSRAKPFGWSWQKDAPAFDLPGLGEHEALMLLMVERHLKSLLPHSTLDVLTPYFNAAAKKLDTSANQHQTAQWTNKVRVIPATQPLQSPQTNPQVVSIVTEALLHEKQLEISYRKRGGDVEVRYRIHPLGLVQRGVVMYLCVRINDYEDIRLLVMHRIQEAKLLNSPIQKPKDFSLDNTIAEGLLDFGKGESIRLELLFTQAAGQHLYETPLSDDQQITEVEDNKLRVTATVADTPQLHWWLLAFGDGVKVMQPKHIRRKMIETASSMGEQYRN